MGRVQGEDNQGCANTEIPKISANLGESTLPGNDMSEERQNNFPNLAFASVPLPNLAFASAPTGHPDSESSDGSTVTRALLTAEELTQQKI
jgi:hypothetical protein